MILGREGISRFWLPTLLLSSFEALPNLGKCDLHMDLSGLVDLCCLEMSTEGNRKPFCAESDDAEASRKTERKTAE